MAIPAASHWTLRDTCAAVALFLASAAVVLWQNTHLAVLWDLSYLLDTSFRITLGQLPYRDFPFSHAPLTFLLQAAIIRLTGRVFFHHVLYAAIVSGLGSVLTWRIALHTLQTKLSNAWPLSLLLSAPLAVLGIYGIYPHPIYDCDCIASILVSLYLLQRLTRKPARITAILAGISLVLPVFFKQNIGLPFLLTAILGILALLIAQRFRSIAPTRHLFTTLVSAAITFLLSILLIHLFFGVHNYLHWTIHFAAQRRLPGLPEMLGVYHEPSLLWTLPCIAVGSLLLYLSQSNRHSAHVEGPRYSARTTTTLSALALILFATPFVATLLLFLRATDPDDRASFFLALWPLVLLISAALALYNLRKPTLTRLQPFLILAAIHGTFLSQQLWGSTYALWPLFVLLLAIAFTLLPPQKFNTALAAAITLTLLVCGTLYLTSEDRLSYADLTTGPLLHSRQPQLKGLSVRGPYLPAFDQLITFTKLAIPPADGILLLNGEDPFFYTTGRAPQFPITLFDPATDPYTPADILPTLRAHNIRWLILKRHFQINDDPTPYRTQTLSLLQQNFTLYRSLDDYDVYTRNDLPLR